MDLSELVALSHRYGGPPFALAGGGNTSVKTADRLWVKASGHALATIAQDGFVELDRPALAAMLDAAGWPTDAEAREAAFVARALAARVHPRLNQRPSVEALLHHLLPGRFVVHTHPAVVNALTCSVDGPRVAAELFPDGSTLWQPYVDPGLTLARSLRALFADHGRRFSHAPAAILLENHGLIVAGDTADEIDRTTAAVVDRLGRRSTALPVPAVVAPLGAYLGFFGRLRPDLRAATDQGEAVRWMVTTQAGRAAATAGPLTPDQIVYCRSEPMWVDVDRDDDLLDRARVRWDAYVIEYGHAPWVVLVAGAGLIALRETAALAETTRAVYADAAAVCRLSAAFGGPQPLSYRDRAFIENWEVEAYRRAVSAGGG